MAAPAASFTVIPTADIDPDSPLTTGLMTSIRDNIENVFAQLVGDPVATPTFTPAAEHDHDGVNSKIVNGADFILVEKKLVTSDVQDLTFSGLNGDTDEIYRLIGRIISGASAPENFTLRPNNISTNQDSINIEQTSSIITRSSTTDLALSRVRSTGILQTFDAIFWAKKNPNSIATNRTLQAQWASYGATGPLTVGHSTGLWDEDTTNITSLVVHGPGAGDIKDGSTVALYKLRQ